MNTTMELNSELLIDKTSYKKFRFDQIAYSISERVEPSQTELDIYYGLEHLDSGSIHLIRHGVPSDVEGTKLRVYPGDIIFGKRRAYQRKAAICEVDAICSAHAMVLRANPKVIHPKLFPFFLHSDLFMNRAIDISVGSLSPTINWGTLKEQEFYVPSIDQQEKLAELLWAGDELISKLNVLQNNCQKLFENYLKSVFDISSVEEKTKLSEIAEITMGQSPEGNTIILDSNGVPFLQGNAEFGKLSPTATKSTTSPSRVCKLNDILISVRAPVGEINIADKSYCIGRGLAAVRLKQGAQVFLKYLLKYNRRELEKVSTGSTFKAINKDNLRNLIVPKFNQNDMSNIVSRIEYFEASIDDSELSICNLKSIERSLINQIF